MKNYDIAIIGGGASGLAAAVSAARINPNLKIVILERLPRIGKKILATGNGRCNYTNRNINKSNYHGSCVPLLETINNFNCEDFFREIGVLGYADDEMRVYPMNNNASSVLDALRLEIAKLGVEVLCDFAVSDIRKEKNNYFISSETQKITSSSVIIASGGMSQSSLGSDGSVIRILKKSDIRISPLQPALTAFKVNPETVRSLKGIRTNASVTLYSENRVIGTERGEVQFGDGSISGICIFNLSCLVNHSENIEISLDLLPDMNFNEAENIIKNIRNIRKNAMLEDFLSGVVNKRIGMNILKSVISTPLTDKTCTLSDKDIKNITYLLKNYKFSITGLAGFEKSQVTAGGIHMSETDNKLRSKKYNKMYFCGEILDIIGDCGGYNLHFAFGSGMVAGRNCAEDLK